MADIWSEALQGLQPRLGQQTYEFWLRPIELHAVEDDVLHLSAPSAFLKEWFETHYLDTVLDEVAARGSRRYRARIEIREPVEPAQPPAAEPEPVPRLAPAPRSPTPARPAANGAQPAPSREPAIAIPVGLCERYRFDSFIKGASNELAASAAWAAASSPGSRFNPLFIYGGVGLGKTHLLHAIGHEIHTHDPRKRVVYLSAERFMNEFITAVRHNQFDEFRRRYREDTDVLLIDDVQIIAGRDRTMDEFFHVFNALYEARKQIVITSDRVPGDMDGMEERITSRLNWGLVADIKPPDLETRVAILQQRAEAECVTIAPEVLLHIAQIVRSNVRELEGALVRICALAEVRGAEITKAFVDATLDTAARTPDPSSALTIDTIQKAVAAYYQLKLADLKGTRRHKGVARPRMLAMYLSRTLTSASYPEIGQRFGGKDHSTVISACRRIETLSQDDPELRLAVETLRRQLAHAT